MIYSNKYSIQKKILSFKHDWHADGISFFLICSHSLCLINDHPHMFMFTVHYPSWPDYESTTQFPYRPFSFSVDPSIFYLPAKIFCSSTVGNTSPDVNGVLTIGKISMEATSVGSDLEEGRELHLLPLSPPSRSGGRGLKLDQYTGRTGHGHRVTLELSRQHCQSGQRCRRILARSFHPLQFAINIALYYIGHWLNVFIEYIFDFFDLNWHETHVNQRKAE